MESMIQTEISSRKPDFYLSTPERFKNHLWLIGKTVSLSGARLAKNNGIRFSLYIMKIRLKQLGRMISVKPPIKTISGSFPS